MIDRRITVRGIIFKDSKLLAQQLTPSFEGIERNFWCTPGGGLDENESLHQGLNREMIEETGITPQIGKLLFVQQFYDNKRENLEFFFHIENADDYKTIDLANTSHGLLEIKKVEFINPTDHELLPDFLQTINIQDYINDNKPVFISNKL
jgi:8-oxo-dGTP pyrophosphatase MutT (NUDIX family)